MICFQHTANASKFHSFSPGAANFALIDMVITTVIRLINLGVSKLKQTYPLDWDRLMAPLFAELSSAKLAPDLILPVESSYRKTLAGSPLVPTNFFQTHSCTQTESVLVILPSQCLLFVLSLPHRGVGACRPLPEHGHQFRSR